MDIDKHKIQSEEAPRPFALHRAIGTGSGVETIKRIETFDTLEEATAHPRRPGWQYVVKHNGEIVWPPSLVKE